MKNLKVMMCCVLAAAMVAGLTACGQKQSAEPEMETQVQEAEAPTQEEPETQEIQSEEPEEKVEEPEASAEAGGKTLIVYYSASGNTKNVADYLAAATNGDIFEIVPAEPYSSEDLDWTDDNSRVVYEHDNPDARDMELVETTVADWEAYDRVFIGYPIWWGIAAWPVDAFVKANDFTGKTVIPFCTSSSSDLGESGELLAEMAGTGDWQEGMRFRSSASKEDVKVWVEGLGL